MQFFYHENGGKETLEMPAEESRHLTKVLRRGVGDDVHVLNGKGRLDRYQIVSNQRTTHLSFCENLEQQDRPPVFIEIAISPTKKADRMEWMVEKMVEIGVHRLVFPETEHGERPYLKTERLMKKAISALKQSGNLWLPELISDINFDGLVQKSAADFKGIAHCADGEKINLDEQTLVGSRSICILIGPEGDFSYREIQVAREHGFNPVTLGKTRLRTETAGVVACTLVNHFCVTLNTDKS